jgi:N-acetyl-anhydromuramyl-L-alanine amidase AmpD
MDEKGFTDIGYHYVVCKDGKIYEGRPVEVVGAHVKGHNIGNIGIGVIGDYNSAELSDAQENALISLIKSLRKKFGIEGDSIYGHRDFGLKRPKDCPGDNLYNKLPEIREKSLPDSQH